MMRDTAGVSPARLTFWKLVRDHDTGRYVARPYIVLYDGMCEVYLSPSQMPRQAAA